MPDTVLVRALVGFVGGPKPGATDEIPTELADIVVAAGLAVRADKLEDRMGRSDWQLSSARQAEVDAAAKPPFNPPADPPEKTVSNQSGGTWGGPT